MKTICFVIAFLFSINAIAQVPLSIPYQAIARNGQGQAIANLSVKVRFSILDSLATGPSVYIETNMPTTSPQGLFSVNVGMGTSSLGTFSAINWGLNAKFLKVELDTTATGNNYVDLGTQQMMSVPYALYAHSANMSNNIELTISGDTLIVGDSSIVVIPGLQFYNNSGGISNGGLLLPFNSVCYDQYIAVNGCGGIDSIFYNGNVYPIIEINGQCWFKKNLLTTKYRNGTPITKLPISQWYNTITPSFTFYNNDSTLGQTYGALYNFLVVSSDSVCPNGWHVSTDCDWMYLEKTIGLNSIEQQLFNDRHTEEVQKIVTTDYSLWNESGYPNWGTNATGFSILGSGYLGVGGLNSLFYGLNNMFSVWTKSNANNSINGNSLFFRLLIAQSLRIDRYNSSDQKYYGRSIRCVKN